MVAICLYVMLKGKAPRPDGGSSSLAVAGESEGHDSNDNTNVCGIISWHND